MSGLICYRCGSEGGGVLLVCGYVGPPYGEPNKPFIKVGCRRSICDRCVAGYWAPDLEKIGIQCPLCEECLNKQ